MNKRIIYQIDGSPLSVITPFDCGLSLIEVGEKDVPSGHPFWIINESELPDRSLRMAWELDFDSAGEPDGYGR